MKINDFKPQYKMSRLAEINFDVFHHALPNIIQFHYEYPKLHQLKVVIKGATIHKSTDCLEGKYHYELILLYF